MTTEKVYQLLIIGSKIDAVKAAQRRGVRPLDVIDFGSEDSPESCLIYGLVSEATDLMQWYGESRNIGAIGSLIAYTEAK